MPVLISDEEKQIFKENFQPEWKEALTVAWIAFTLTFLFIVLG